MAILQNLGYCNRASGYLANATYLVEQARELPNLQPKYLVIMDNLAAGFKTFFVYCQ